MYSAEIFVGIFICRDYGMRRVICNKYWFFLDTYIVNTKWHMFPFYVVFWLKWIIVIAYRYVYLISYPLLNAICNIIRFKIYICWSICDRSCVGSSFFKFCRRSCVDFPRTVCNCSRCIGIDGKEVRWCRRCRCFCSRSRRGNYRCGSGPCRCCRGGRGKLLTIAKDVCPTIIPIIGETNTVGATEFWRGVGLENNAVSRLCCN